MEKKIKKDKTTLQDTIHIYRLYGASQYYSSNLLILAFYCLLKSYLMLLYLPWMCVQKPNWAGFKVKKNEKNKSNPERRTTQTSSPRASNSEELDGTSNPCYVGRQNPQFFKTNGLVGVTLKQTSGKY